jgi:protein ImuA
LRESGQPYGLGLDEIGLQPERLVTVAATRVRDVLWAMEEALRCKALAAVIGEVREARSLDDVAARRLSLAANAGGALALLMLARASPHPSPAVTRWVVGAAPSAPDHHGIGPPRIRVDLVRNRLGRLGTWMLEWSCVDQRFHLASTHPEPLAPAVIDRQDQAAVA